MIADGGLGKGEFLNSSVDKQKLSLENSTSKQLSELKNSFGDVSHLKGKDLNSWKENLSILNKGELESFNKEISNVSHLLTSERINHSQNNFKILAGKEKGFDIDSALKGIG